MDPIVEKFAKEKFTLGLSSLLNDVDTHGELLRIEELSSIVGKKGLPERYNDSIRIFATMRQQERTGVLHPRVKTEGYMEYFSLITQKELVA